MAKIPFKLMSRAQQIAIILSRKARKANKSYVIKKITKLQKASNANGLIEQ